MKIPFVRLGIFGQSLDDTYRYAIDKTSLVPVIVRQCCEFLLEYGTTFVGLFRYEKQTSLSNRVYFVFVNTVYQENNHSSENYVTNTIDVNRLN